MARLDKSQGFTVVYSDLSKEFKKNENINAQDAAVLAIDKRAAFQRPMGVVEAEERAIRKTIGSQEDPLASLRQNLNSLSKAHARLRFLLEEIDTLTKKSSERK